MPSASSDDRPGAKTSTGSPPAPSDGSASTGRSRLSSMVPRPRNTSVDPAASSAVASVERDAQQTLDRGPHGVEPAIGIGLGDPAPQPSVGVVGQVGVASRRHDDDRSASGHPVRPAAPGRTPPGWRPDPGRRERPPGRWVSAAAGSGAAARRGHLGPSVLARSVSTATQPRTGSSATASSPDHERGDGPVRRRRRRDARSRCRRPGTGHGRSMSPITAAGTRKSRGRPSATRARRSVEETSSRGTSTRIHGAMAGSSTGRARPVDHDHPREADDLLPALPGRRVRPPRRRRRWCEVRHPGYRSRSSDDGVGGVAAPASIDLHGARLDPVDVPEAAALHHGQPIGGRGDGPGARLLPRHDGQPPGRRRRAAGHGGR